MSIHEPVDPAGRRASHAKPSLLSRAEHARASLRSRVERLKHQLTDARHQLDLPAQITQHPLPAVAIAFALGAAVGLRDSRRPAERPDEHTLRSAVVTTF